MGTAEDVERSPAGAGGLRKIIHIDMDAFYASVEQREPAHACIATKAQRYDATQYRPAKLIESERAPTNIKLKAQVASRLNQLRDTNLRPR